MEIPSFLVNLGGGGASGNSACPQLREGGGGLKMKCANIR